MNEIIKTLLRELIIETLTEKPKPKRRRKKTKKAKKAKKAKK